MELTQEQAFKAGFLLRCAEEGLTKAETHLRIKKALSLARENKPMTKSAINIAALLGLGPFMGGLFQGAGTAAKGVLDFGGRALTLAPSIASTAGLTGVALPIAAGAGTGYLAAKATSPDGANLVEDAKRDEILDEYERLAEEARRRTRLKKLQARTGKRVIPISPSLGSGY